jgi:hypothetical protein
MHSELISRLRRVWGRATPQVRRPFYIGLAVGLVLAALVLAGFLNTGTFFAMPSAFEGRATSQAIWGLKPSNLLMVLPLGAFLVVLARSFIGVKAFGLFTPMLIALAFLQIGPVMGPIVLGTSVLTGMIVTPTLLKLRMTRVGFLGVLISLVVLVLVALQVFLGANLQVDAFPVIVCALVVERWWKQWEKDGPKEAAYIAVSTFVLALVIQFVMVSQFALSLIEMSPLLMPAFTAVAIGILGRYRGLRLSEIKRFAPIWLERRRMAREQTLDDDEVEELFKRRAGIGIDEAKERAAPVEGIWVISSPQDLTDQGRRRRVPQPIRKPDSGAQFEPRIGASGTKRNRPLVHNAWIIRDGEDV